MPCDPKVFEGVSIFSLLDADERAVLAEQVDLRRFAPRQRIYRAGDRGEKAYVLLKGRVHVVLIDDDNQEVVVDAPGSGEIFGLASMLSDSPHRTSAVAQEETSAIEVTREDLAALIQRKPMAGLDVLTMASRQFHAAQDLVRMRAARNPNEVIAEIRPPSGAERPRRSPGMLKGKIRMAEDFDLLPDDILSAMEGNGG